MILEDPPSFVVRTEAEKAAFELGFRRVRGTQGPWLQFGSTTAPATIWIGGAGPKGPWFLAVDHQGVATEFGPSIPLPGPGAGRYACPTLADLYDALNRVWRLARSLPNAPLLRFQQQTANLPRTTEAERLVVQRVGQSLFRDALIEYWGGGCPLTGITDPVLLRASHIVAWSECETDALRLDVHNGLLLSALWDAAFDAGLISFTDDGALLTSPELSVNAAIALGVGVSRPPLPLVDAHRPNLRLHRTRHGY